jgi:hypothetical protein
MPFPADIQTTGCRSGSGAIDLAIRKRVEEDLRPSRGEIEVVGRCPTLEGLIGGRIMPLVERDVKPAATEEPGSFFYQEPNSGLARDESRNIFEDGVYTLNEYALSATNLALYR